MPAAGQFDPNNNDDPNNNPGPPYTGAADGAPGNTTIHRQAPVTYYNGTGNLTASRVWKFGAVATEGWTLGDLVCLSIPEHTGTGFNITVETIAAATLAVWGPLAANGGAFWFNGTDFQAVIPGADQGGGPSGTGGILYAGAGAGTTSNVNQILFPGYQPGIDTTDFNHGIPLPVQIVIDTVAFSFVGDPANAGPARVSPAIFKVPPNSPPGTAPTLLAQGPLYTADTNLDEEGTSTLSPTLTIPAGTVILLGFIVSNGPLAVALKSPAISVRFL